jgi:hypothetical protein
MLPSRRDMPLPSCSISSDWYESTNTDANVRAPATDKRPETRPGTGRARIAFGDKTDGDEHISLFAGRVLQVLKLLALLVQKYLLYLRRAHLLVRGARATGAQITCFTGTKVLALVGQECKY